MAVAQTVSSGSVIDVTCVSEHENGLTIAWSDGHESFFHYIWLRDCCECEQCGSSYTGKRFVVPSDIALDVRPQTVDTASDGQLVITWAPDGHRSRFEAVWLRRHCYDDASRKLRRHDPVLWDAGIMAALPEADFTSVRDDMDARLGLYRKLRDYGFVVVRDGPTDPGSVEAVANLIGDLGESAYDLIFDLTPKGKVRTMGNTLRMVPPHTDEAYRFAPPGINVLHCVRPAEDGGDSILVDGFNIAEQLRRDDPASFELLANQPHMFHRLHDGTFDQRAYARMIALDDRGQVVGVRIHTRTSGPMDLPSDIVEPFYAAHHKLSALMMSPANQAQFALGAGDAVMFDNHRVLHARASFTDPERFLQICNVSREGFHERLRLLAAELGFDDEAQQVLASGMAW